MKSVAAILFIGATGIYLLCGFSQVFGMIAFGCDIVALGLLLLTAIKA